MIRLSELFILESHIFFIEILEEAEELDFFLSIIDAFITQKV
jgi:hypothetical protein